MAQWTKEFVDGRKASLPSKIWDIMNIVLNREGGHARQERHFNKPGETARRMAEDAVKFLPLTRAQREKASFEVASDERMGEDLLKPHLRRSQSA